MSPQNSETLWRWRTKEEHEQDLLDEAKMENKYAALTGGSESGLGSAETPNAVLEQYG